jgi:hypothetical protein
MFRRLSAIASIAFASAAFAAGPPPNVLSPELHALAANPRVGVEVPVIITFADRVNPARFRNYTTKRERRHRLLVALKEKSQDIHRKTLRDHLRARGAKHIKPLWLSNSLKVTLPVTLLPEIARLSNVARVRLDVVVKAPTTNYDAETLAEWNLQVLRAPEVWTQGYQGQGVTVAILDTGVDVSHPDLAGQYRGGTNSWFDPYGEHAVPYDAAGHGTSVAGLVLGRNATGSAIGMAPNAQWIAAKIFDDNGLATLSAIHQAFEWLLDPDGNPATDDAPDLVNASWGLTGAGACTDEFESDVQALRAAGIGIAFSAGNDGPGTATTVSPGNNAGVLSVAAVDANDNVALFSSRGPSACDGAMDPELSAPGVSVLTADTSFGQGNGAYAYVTGTSFAAPHVTGAMALLWSARPTAGVAELEAALRDTARDAGDAGPDNDTGHGVIDVALALERVLAGEAPIAGADSATTNEDTAVTIDVLSNDSDPRGAPLTLAAAGTPTRHGGTTLVNADGTIRYTPAVDFAGIDSFSYTISNGRVSGVGRVTITVQPVNDAPRASDDAFTLTADAASGQYALAAPGVLANDSDPDGDAVSVTLVSNVAAGSVQLQPDGGFLYTPPAGAVSSGPHRFTYRLSDGVSTGNIASVTFTLNRAPVATNDSYTLAAPDADGRYSVANPGVLANDSDPDGNPISATLVENVAQGSVQLLPGGGFSYTPPAGGAPAGVLRFTYQASDGVAAGNVATVSFTVNRAPVAGNDRYAFTVPDAAGRFSVPAPGVLANDSDVDGQPLTATLATNVSEGSVALAPDGGFSYMPPAGGAPRATLRFTYRASDGHTAGNEATVSFTVNRAPGTRNDVLVLNAASGSDTYTLAAPGVLANDTDADGDALSAVLVGGVSSGTLDLAASGAISYTPPATGAPSGALEFTYRARDWLEDSGIATASITLNRAPRAGDDSGIVLVDTGNGYRYASSSGVLANDSDPEGQLLTPVLLTNVGHGSVSLTPNGGFVYTPPPEGTPDGALSFTYQVSDGHAVSNVATVTFSVYTPPDPGVGGFVGYTPFPASLTSQTSTASPTSTPASSTAAATPNSIEHAEEATTEPKSGTSVEPARPEAQRNEARRVEDEDSHTIARDDDYLLDEPNDKGIYAIDAPGVLANDRGGDKRAAVLVKNARAGKITLAANGGFTYTPPTHGMPDGDMSFSYRIREGTSTSNEAAVTLRFQRPLAARPDTFVLEARDKRGEYRVGPPGVLANDTGPGSLRAVLVQDVAAGRLKLAPDGGFSYTPPDGGVSAGPLSFSYKVASGKLTSRTATVLLSVNQPLAARADQFVLAAMDDQGRYVLSAPGVLANDTGNGALTATLVRNAANGNVALAPNGGFVYTPPSNGVPGGTLSFTYKASDGKGTSEASVTFTLRPPPKSQAGKLAITR